MTRLVELADRFGLDKGSVRLPAHGYAFFDDMLFERFRDLPVNILELGLARTAEDYRGCSQLRTENFSPSVSMWPGVFPERLSLSRESCYDESPVHTFKYPGWVERSVSDMSTRFAIIALQRTGSNMLVSALSQHREVYCFGELFRHQIIKQIDDLWPLEDIHPLFSDPEYRQAHPEAYAQACFALRSSYPFVGLKLMLGQNNQMLESVARNDWKRLLLRRENALASYSSEKIAKTTGQGILFKGQNAKRARIRFSEADFERYLTRRQRLYDHARRVLKEADQGYLELEYREICAPAGIARVLDYLGVEQSGTTEPQTAKRNSSRIIERFENPKAVMRCLDWVGRPDWTEENF